MVIEKAIEKTEKKHNSLYNLKSVKLYLSYLYIAFYANTDKQRKYIKNKFLWNITIFDNKIKKAFNQTYVEVYNDFLYNNAPNLL